MDYLSCESLDLLKVFSKGLTIHDDSIFDQANIDQLEDYGLIERHIVNYHFSSDSTVKPSFSDYSITEKGKGYLLYCEHSEAFRQSAQEIADSAKTQSDIAIKKAKQADVKGWIAVTISVFALLIDFICNYEQISAFWNLLF